MAYKILNLPLNFLNDNFHVSLFSQMFNCMQDMYHFQISIVTISLLVHFIIYIIVQLHCYRQKYLTRLMLLYYTYTIVVLYGYYCCYELHVGCRDNPFDTPYDFLHFLCLLYLAIFGSHLTVNTHCHYCVCKV